MVFFQANYKYNVLKLKHAFSTSFFRSVLKKFVLDLPLSVAETV